MMSLLPLTEIENKALEQQDTIKALEWVRQSLAEDTRSGAKKLILKFEKRAAHEEKESKKLEALWHYEKEAFNTTGYSFFSPFLETKRIVMIFDSEEVMMPSSHNKFPSFIIQVPETGLLTCATTLVDGVDTVAAAITVGVTVTTVAAAAPFVWPTEGVGVALG